MFELILVAQGIKKNYQMISADFKEEDFFPLSESQIKDLNPQEPYYMMNPEKLKDKYKLSSDRYIISESEKNIMLKARKIIFKYSTNLRDTATLQERLLYAKKFFPPIFFEDTEEK